jgi:hypothetical protein
MADRLAELLRQRALLQDHVAWLDREIAVASGSSTVALPGTPPVAGSPVPASPGEIPIPTPEAPVPVTRPAPIATPVPAPTPTPPAGVAVSAEEILDRYRVEPRAVHTDVRKGCFLYLAAAFAVVIAGVAILYFAFRR